MLEDFFFRESRMANGGPLVDMGTAQWRPAGEWSASGLADLRFGAHRARLPPLGPAPQPQPAEQADEDDEAVEAAGRRHGHRHAGAGGAHPEAQAEQGAPVDVPAP